MSNTMKKFAFFTIFDCEKEQDWLAEKHRAGWKLESVSFPGIYRFSRCTPENVVYQLDYNKEGLDNKSEYVRMFADCGWEYIDVMAGFSYFRKSASEMNGREEIFSDDASKLEMMERIYKGRLTPLLVILFALIIPQLFVQFHNSSSAGDLLFGIYCGLFVAYAVIFILFAVNYHKFKNR